MIFTGIEEDFTRLENAKIVFLPVPYDGTSTWIKGSDKGPDAIIEASCNMELFDIETDTEVYLEGIHTAPPVIGYIDPEEMVNEVHRRVKEYLKMGKFVVTVGGEHSITTGPVRAHAGKYPGMTVLQLDAHTDLRPEYEGTRYNHASVMSRCSEICPVVQVGIRSMDVSEKEFIVEERIFFAEDLGDSRSWISKVMNQLSENVYVTIDLDVFDPSIMASTGTPEPGGMGWYDVLNLLREVNDRVNIIGFDVMELCPNPANKAPDFLASKLIYKLLSYRFNK